VRGSPSWTSAPVAIVFSRPVDAGSPRGELVGSFDGTVMSRRPGDRSSSRVGVCRLRRWRRVFQPTAASPPRRLLHRAFPEFRVRFAGRHEPGDHITVNGLNGFTGSVQIALSTLPAGVTSNPSSPFRPWRQERPSPSTSARQTTQHGEFHDFRGGNQRRIVRMA